MRVFVQRVSRDTNHWRIRFSAAGTNAFTGNLITTVLVTTNATLPEAINTGAKDARKRFDQMRAFNKASEAHS